MKFNPIEPPRIFSVGKKKSIHIKHCANAEMKPDEQITFVTQSGTEYDVVRKSWGYYATGSMNGRLKKSGLRAVLTRGKDGKLYLLLVEKGSEAIFQEYIDVEEHTVVCWLDSDKSVREVCEYLKKLTPKEGR